MKTVFLFFILLFVSSIPAWAAAGKAEIKSTSPDAAIIGEAVFEETSKGLKVSATVQNAPPGKHGFDTHEVGSCADAGNAAGGHFNPDGKPHGDAAHGGPAHQGDMGNIVVGPDGNGILDVTLPDVKLSEGRYAVNGKAVILHEKEDDFGQPTGN